MVHPIDIFIIEIIIVELGMIIRLHEASAGKIVYHGGNACYGNGEVVRPGLNGRCYSGFFRIGRSQSGQLFQEGLKEGNVFPGTSDSGPGSVRQSGQLEVQIGDHAAPPGGMYGKYLLISTCGPVKLRVDDAPFLCRHGTEGQCVFGLIAGFKQCFADAQHHCDGGIVILKAVKVRIIMGGKHDPALRMPTGNLTDDIIGSLILFHQRNRIQKDRDFPMRSKCFLQSLRILSRYGEGGGFAGTGDILRVQCHIVYLAIASGLHGNYRCRAL